MRIVVFIASIITAVSLLYRWRYRILNTVLAISYLRKIAVSISMNMPMIKSRILPRLLNKTNSSSV